MTTVALKGKLELGEDKKWHWKGKWAFGSHIEEFPTKASPKHQPFHYSFEDAADPATVAVPSLTMPPPPIEESYNEEPADQTPISSIADEAEDRKSEQTAEPSKDMMLSNDEAEETAEVTTSRISGNVEEAQMTSKESKSGEMTELATATSTSTTTPEPNREASSTSDTTDTVKDNFPLESNENEARDPPKPLEKSLSFAAVPEGDPEFTEASFTFGEKHDTCPASGQWRGYFQNATAGRGKGTQRVQEIFYLFLNAAPGEGAAFLYEEGGMFPPPQVSSPVLVRGVGDNPFGTFEIRGYLDLSTMTMEIQRQYVLVQGETTPTKRKRQRNSTPVMTRHKTARPYFTRKRQPSWKRKSQEESDEEPYRRRKRKLTIDVTAKGDGTKSNTPTSTTSAGTAKSVGSTPISMQLSTASPVNAPVAKTPLKRRSSTGSTGSSRKKSSSSGTPKASPKAGGATSSMFLKLPPTGDPKKARWRAAHFLYYQRHDPEEQQQQQNQPSNANVPAVPPPPVNNNPKYVIYEGEMADSKREGRGICLYSNNMLYEGEWKRNKEHGIGKLMTADRSRIIYDGEFERGRMQGQGTYYYAQAENTNFSGEGARYIGEFKENMRNGFGKYYLPDKSVFDGTWRDGMMNGRGVFTWPDMSVYDGEWKDGKR